jgi:hypothetical protein
MGGFIGGFVMGALFGFCMHVILCVLAEESRYDHEREQARRAMWRRLDREDR